MAVSFPVFHGWARENASEFLDNLEMAHLISGRDTNKIKLRDFPLVLKEEAQTWYDNLPLATKEDWDNLTQSFKTRFGRGDTTEGVWKLLLQHRQVNLFDFANYESKF